MTVPGLYQRATVEFNDFMAAARDAADLQTTNQAFTMVEGVLLAFRRRLSPKDALAFADVLPAVLRAVFVANWDIERPPVPFADRATMTKEVQSLRAGHNFAPDHAISAVASALWKHVDAASMRRVLASLPPGAREFWQ